MSKKTLIWLAVAVVIIVTAVIIFLNYKKKQAATITTTQTGTKKVNTTTFGNNAPSTSTGAGNVEGGPVYQVGWDGFKTGDQLENISNGVLIMNGIIRLCTPPSLNDSLNKIITKSTIGQCGAINSIQLNALNPSGAFAIPQGVFGNINYIDSSVIQIRSELPILLNSGSTPASWAIGVKFFTFNRTDFNANFSNKIGVKQF